MDLDPSLAYTAVIEMCVPMRSDVAAGLYVDLARDMSAANPRDRWEFAARWLLTNAPEMLKIHAAG